MNVSTPVLQATALCLSLLWLVLALANRPRRPLNIVWALFCGSIAMFMARGLVGPDAGTWYVLFGVGACFTCNGFWLVARALFREGRPFRASHMGFVGLAGVLIILSQFGMHTPLAQALDEVLSLLSSTTLVLAFWEGLRGWSSQRGMERVMRAVFMVTYGGCVGIALLLPILLGPSSGAGALGAAAAAATIVFVMQGLVAWRMRHPLEGHVHVDADASCEAEATSRLGVIDVPCIDTTSDAVIRDEDAALARELEQHMRTQQPFLQPELKLSHLAQALDVSEYRISRAIHDVLEHRNISQYVNAFRLEHAQALLANPDCDAWSTLVIGLESGFGSLGAFHRAFKTATGCPPGEFRAARQVSVAMHATCVGVGRS
ncbi:helix-turn-helix transcriptional regulator [Thermomonas sp.]|uniref:helix-turn-helix domain-containing protein n=1 Tax=Thermomonas sp. TaxID=1971895 RepID=UPI0024887CEA|nr:helix-turn-helix transcriptional regulator [Thermomonas sp.]MDI1252687.1 helix-turn-helix transcriptional regulator [Thermomonas sp.]